MNELEKTLGKDPDGMAVYEYIVNHSDSCELRETDDNFRRIYKRIYPQGAVAAATATA